MPPWIERVVQKIAPLAGWEDLDLPGDSISSMKRIVQEGGRHAAASAKNGSGGKGKARPGAVALFDGPPTTAKVTAAQVLARELGMNLFRIDVSLIVSDRLEETERILKRIIDSAEEARGVLFFDEIDVSFGIDDRGSHVDKGIGYLLKRAHRYEDLSILAVGDMDAMDPVHRRKLRSVVRFP